MTQNALLFLTLTNSGLSKGLVHKRFKTELEANMAYFRVKHNPIRIQGLAFSPWMESIKGNIYNFEDITDERGYYVLLDDYGLPIGYFHPEWLESLGIAPTTNHLTESRPPTRIPVDDQKLVLPKPIPEETMDVVNKPSHYQFSKYEPVKVIQAWDLSFCLGNVVKYIARAGRKDSTKLIEDLEKAKRYIELELENLREQNDK